MSFFLSNVDDFKKIEYFLFIFRVTRMRSTATMQLMAILTRSLPHPSATPHRPIPFRMVGFRKEIFKDIRKKNTLLSNLKKTRQQVDEIVLEKSTHTRLFSYTPYPYTISYVLSFPDYPCLIVLFVFQEQSVSRTKVSPRPRCRSKMTSQPRSRGRSSTTIHTPTEWSRTRSKGSLTSDFCRIW